MITRHWVNLFESSIENKSALIGKTNGRASIFYEQKIFILCARYFCDRMDVQISQICTDWYGFFKQSIRTNRCKSVKSVHPSYRKTTQRKVSIVIFGSKYQACPQNIESENSNTIDNPIIYPTFDPLNDNRFLPTKKILSTNAFNEPYIL
ncbi:MAG: hypothetical protein RL329_703 [Bacteroidota bacterium]